MLGVILCGGQSTRMGTDKGLIKLHANTWAQTAVDKISSLHVNVVLSVNENQYSDYSEVFPEKQLIKDNPELTIKGPLAGVLSVHLQFPGEDLFVLACDMPLMDAVILNGLLGAYNEQPSAEAYVFTRNDEPEPLCAIYTAKGLAYIIHLLKAKELTRHSMKFMLEHIHTCTIPLHEDQNKYFRNFNAHAELNGL
ncbi:MAG: molybdopterin-guanine dinucleotide biosynthesis protein [Ferruginibacter sp.]|nr:molybdopterin-guanine dinucleotide biosynthesis protein [Ferruginibacter sp.]